MNALVSPSAGMGFLGANPLLARLLLASIEFAVLALVMAGAIKLWGSKRPRVAVYLWAIVLVKPLISLLAGTPLPVFSLAATNRVAIANDSSGSQEVSAGSADVTPHSAPEDLDVHFAQLAEPLTSTSGPETSRLSVSEQTPRRVAGNAAIPIAGADESHSDLKWVTWLWIFGCLAVSAWLLRSRREAARLAASGARAPESVSGVYAGLSAELGVKRLPRLRLVDGLPSPALVGVVRPTILLPAWLADESQTKSSDVLRWSLRHELTHFRSGDPWLLLLRDAVRAVFFFHPAAWWCGTRLEEVIEVACDHSVVANRRQATEYAKGLYELLNRTTPHRFAVGSGGLFATRTQIGHRIASLLQGSLVFGGHLGPVSVAATLLIAATALCVGIGVQTASRADQHESRESDAGERADRERQANSQPDEASDSLVLLSGTVLLSDGHPAAGADVYFDPPTDGEGLPADQWPHTRADSQGRFELRVESYASHKRQHPSRRSTGNLFAVAEGYGFAMQPVNSLTDDTDDVELHLAPDRPIEGQIVDLEGRPIAGADVHVEWVWWNVEVNLDAFIRAVEVSGDGLRLDRSAHVLPGRSQVQKTDAAGRFRFDGLGEERFVRLNIAGPGMHHYWIGVVTRQTDQEMLSPPPRSHYGLGSWPLYGAKFQHIATPGRDVAGTIHDASTGEPVAGARVTSRETLDEAVSDRRGRFVLHGLVKRDRHILKIVPPSGGEYLPRTLSFADAPGLAPQEVQVDMIRGIQVRGTVRAEGLDLPLRGRVEYFALHPNEHVVEYKLTADPGNEVDVNPDGTFSIAVIPGAGAIAYRPDRSEVLQTAYVPPEAAVAVVGDGAQEEEFTAEQLPTAQATGDGGVARGSMGQTFYADIALIHPSKEDLTAHVMLKVSRGAELHGRIVGPDGRPVSGVQAGGVMPDSVLLATTLDSSEFSLAGWNPARPRHLWFHHREKGLGAVADVDASTEGPLEVRLEPCGSVSGRLLDEEGEPLPNISMNLTPRGVTGVTEFTQVTDENGGFRFENVVPGQPHMIYVVGAPVIVKSKIVVEAGEDRDLGDVKMWDGAMKLMRRVER